LVEPGLIQALAEKAVQASIHACRHSLSPFLLQRPTGTHIVRVGLALVLSAAEPRGFFSQAAFVAVPVTAAGLGRP
jgi:hypothetical protein